MTIIPLPFVYLFAKPEMLKNLTIEFFWCGCRRRASMRLGRTPRFFEVTFTRPRESDVSEVQEELEGRYDAQTRGSTCRR